MQEYDVIVEILDEYVKVSEIHPEDNFKSDLDMSSFELIGFASDVKESFGVDLRIEDFIDNPTVIQMAEHIAEMAKE